MTARERLASLDEAHAGDLVGYTRDGRPMHLPGGGAEIVVDDGDDDPDDLGGTSAPSAATSTASATDDSAPTVEELRAELERLRLGNQRNNRELKSRREVGQWMQAQGITDLADLQARLEAAAPPVVDSGSAPAAATPDPVAPAAPAGPVIDDAEITRRVELELEKRGAADRERADRLGSSLRQVAFQQAMTELGFQGTFDRALKVADLDAITISEDGQVSGAKEAAESLRTEIPEWFRRANGGSSRRTGEDVDGGARRPAKPAPKSWEELAAARMIGSRQ